MMVLANWYVPVFAVAFAFVAVLLILFILIQKPKGGGLAGAFGGGGGGGTQAFGAKTGDMLTFVTIILFVLFILLGMIMVWSMPSGKQEAAQEKLPNTVVSPPADDEERGVPFDDVFEPNALSDDSAAPPTDTIVPDDDGTTQDSDALTTDTDDADSTE